MIINLGCASVDNHIPRDDIFDYHPLRECDIYIICNNIDKPLMVYRFMGNVMTFITTLRHNDKIIAFQQQKCDFMSYNKYNLTFALLYY